MDASFPYRLITDASLFTDETLLELRKIVTQYPAFPVAKVLYLKNLAVLDHPDFLKELKKFAVAIPDRRKLFLLIEDKLKEQSSITMVKEEERENAFDLIDAFLSEQGQAVSKDWDRNLLNSSVSSDYIFWSLAEQSQEEASQSVQLKEQQLIDSFIKNEEERPRRFLSQDKETTGENVQVAEESEMPEFLKPQDDYFFTETLAQIYIRQKRYERALQIIEKLSLKYPEKNVYFADQIRFLEKLIINNKNLK